MKFEIELSDGKYQLVVDAEITGTGATSGAENPDDLYGYMDIDWGPVSGIKWDVYGNFVVLNPDELCEVAELYQEEAQTKITEKFMEYAKEYAESAAMDAVDREFCGDY